MRLTITLLFLTMVQVSAATFAQKLSLKKNGITLKEVFKAIKKQTGYDVLYQPKKLKDNQKINVDFNNTPLKDVVEACLVGRGLDYILYENAIVIKEESTTVRKLPEAIAQLVTISGKVTDTAGVPLPGATIKVKGGNQVTATNVDGAFLLKNVEVNAIIQVSFTGYVVQELKVTTVTSLLIKLETHNSALTEVVIVSYGSQSKKDVVSSVSQIKGDEIRKSPSPDLQNMLVGKLTGFTAVQNSGQPGSDAASFYIRGVESPNGSQPLIIVDDVQSDYGQFSKINPSEVESVSVLKDATSTAMYGIKGANGVILVTTKRGKTGPAHINFITQAAIQTTIKPQQFLDSYNAAILSNEATANTNIYTGVNATLPFKEQDLQAFKDGSDPYRHPNNDWYNTLFKPVAFMNTNNLTISGGSDRVKYFVSLGDVWQNGDLRSFTPPASYRQSNINSNDYYERYNFRSNLDIKATNSLSFKVDLSGNSSVSNQPALINPYYEVAFASDLAPWIYNIYNPNGTYGYNDGTITSQPAGRVNNIIGVLALGGYSRLLTTQINANFSATQKLDVLTKGLSASASVAYTNLAESTRNLTGGDFPSYQYDPITKNYIPRDINVFRVAPLVASVANVPLYPLTRINLNANVNYARSFGDNNVGALILFNQNTQTTPSANPLNNLLPSVFRGYSYRATYNYKHKYLFESTGAYNGTSNFLKHYDFFPSVSIGYNVSEEAFFKKALPFVSDLRFKGSFGYTGSDNIAGFAYTYVGTYLGGQTGYNFGDNNGGANIAGITEGNIPNNDVVWEKDKKIDLGMDFGLFNNKIIGSIGVFSNLRYDILINRQTIPAFFGVVSSNLPAVNLGRVANKGLEAELTYNGKAGKLNYRITVMYSYARNKILNIDEPVPLYPWLQQTGHSLGTQLLYISQGYYTQAEVNQMKLESAQIAAGTLTNRTIAVPPGPIPLAGMLKYADLNGDGVINSLDEAYTGNSNLPNTNVSLNLSASYKGFSAGVLLQGAYNYNLQFGPTLTDPNKVNFQAFMLDRWTPATAATATYPTLLANPSYQSSSTPSTYWSLPVHYVRIRQADIGYTFSANWVKRAHIQNLRLFVNGSNLLTWSNTYDRFQIDPEVANNGTKGYPNQRIYNLGLDITL